MDGELILALALAIPLVQSILGWRWFLILGGALWWLMGRRVRWLVVGLIGGAGL